MSPEHIIPESLGNDELLLLNEVCDQCNQFFGSKIENFVLNKTPLAFWRTYLGIRNKKGKLPHVDLSQPRRQRGTLPSTHSVHDNFVGFTCCDDYSVSVDIGDDRIIQEILSGKKNQFTFVFTPEVLSKMGRFFLKVGLELVCLYDSPYSRSDVFLQARRFARFGEFEGLWPVFHFRSRCLRDLKTYRENSQGVDEEVFCYNYSILEVGDKYQLSVLSVGTDTWVVCLNDPYPTPEILTAFPNENMKLIWYGPDEIRGDK